MSEPTRDRPSSQHLPSASNRPSSRSASSDAAPPIGPTKEGFHDAFKEPIIQALRSAPAAVSEPEKNPLNETQKRVEDSFRSFIKQNPHAAWRSYCDLPDAAGGSLVNVDLARWLCAEYACGMKQDEDARRMRTQLTPATYQPAKEYCNTVFKTLLSESPGHTPVIFTSGGPASGKSGATRMFFQNVKIPSDDFPSQPIVYDTSFADINKAKADIAMCGKRPIHIIYVGCEFEGAMNSMVDRSLSPGSDYGRYISAQRMARLHSDSLATIKTLDSELSKGAIPGADVNISYFHRDKGKVEQLSLDILRQKPILTREELSHVAHRILGQRRDRLPDDLFAAIHG